MITAKKRANFIKNYTDFELYHLNISQQVSVLDPKTDTTYDISLSFNIARMTMFSSKYIFTNTLNNNNL